MKLRVQRKDLLQALESAIPVTNTLIFQEILRNVHISINHGDGHFTLSATNNMSFYRTTVSCDVSLDSDDLSDFIINAEVLYGIAKNLTSTDIELIHTGGPSSYITIRGGDSVCKLLFQSSLDFPDIFQHVLDQDVTIIDAQEMHDKIKVASFFTNSNVFLDYQHKSGYLRIFATDGKCLYVSSLPINGDVDYDVYPLDNNNIRSLLKFLRNIEGSVEVSVIDGFIIFSEDKRSRTFGIKYTSDSMHPIDSIIESIDQTQLKTKIDISHFLSKLTLFNSLLTKSDDLVSLRFFLHSGQLDISCKTFLGEADDTIICDYSGEDFHVAYKIGFVSLIFSKLKGKGVDFRILDQEHSNLMCIVSDDDSLFLLAPLSG